MSQRTLVLSLLALLVLLFSPEGMAAGTLQLALVAAAGFSAIKDAGEE